MSESEALRPAPGARVESELVEKRSRFIAVVARADTEDEARDLVSEARAAHPQARHHCTAWVLPGTGGPAILHSSDDGEPSGTAGRPMLDRLTGAGLGHVAAVVIRYFGGTLLGTGGLVRAYGDAVGQALTDLPTVRVRTLTACAVTMSHAAGARLESELRSGPTSSLAEVLDVAWLPNGVRIDVASADVAALATRVAELTAGEGRITEIGPHELEV
jgi:uncharacterized YigZ family protein